MLLFVIADVEDHIALRTIQLDRFPWHSLGRYRILLPWRRGVERRVLLIPSGQDKTNGGEAGVATE